MPFVIDAIDGAAALRTDCLRAADMSVLVVVLFFQHRNDTLEYLPNGSTAGFKCRGAKNPREVVNIQLPTGGWK